MKDFKESVQEELERRKATFKAIDAALDKHFDFFPLPEFKQRLRRNQVHITILKEWGFDAIGNWRIKRLIKERLAARGVRFVINEGKRMFVGMDYKKNGTAK